MTTQNPSSILTFSHRCEAEIYLSEDHAFILHVLADGTTLRLTRSRYDHLLGKCRGAEQPRLTRNRRLAILFWVMRFAVLIATAYGHLRR